MCTSEHSHSNHFSCYPNKYVIAIGIHYCTLTESCILGNRHYDDNPRFWSFKQQLYHTSVLAVLCSLQPGMITPVICRCPDEHFQHVIYDLIAFIADYPKQAMLTGIVQGWCPKCTALAGNLEAQAIPRTSALTDGLVEILDSRTLWVKYGIHKDTIVRSWVSI